MKIQKHVGQTSDNLNTRECECVECENRLIHFHGACHQCGSSCHWYDFYKSYNGWNNKGTVIQTDRLIINLSLKEKLSSTNQVINTNYLINSISAAHKTVTNTVNAVKMIRDQIENLSDKINNLTKQFQRFNTENVLAIKRQMEDMVYVSYDGRLIWKINDVATKQANAKSGKETSIDSPIFYSSPTGYKMHVRLFLNGDGDAHGTHLSVAFLILKGDYDAILPWPFNFLITFCLFDQTDHGHHHKDSLTPDPATSIFQGSNSQIIIPGCILKFFPLQCLENSENIYIRDDTMFIEVMVNCDPEVQNTLPFTSHSNPALPTHIQHIIRCKEIENYKRLRAEIRAQIRQDDENLLQLGLIPPCS